MSTQTDIAYNFLSTLCCFLFLEQSLWKKNHSYGKQLGSSRRLLSCTSPDKSWPDWLHVHIQGHYNLPRNRHHKHTCYKPLVGYLLPLLPGMTTNIFADSIRNKLNILQSEDIYSCPHIYFRHSLPLVYVTSKISSYMQYWILK